MYEDVLSIRERKWGPRFPIARALRFRRVAVALHFLGAKSYFFVT